MPDGTVFYATSVFEPAFAFVAGEDWEIATAGPTEATDTLLIETPGPGGGELLFVNPTHVYNRSNISEPKEVPAPENAKDWVTWFQRHPNLDTSKPLAVSVGDASGMQIDVTASSVPKNYPRDLCGGEPCVPLYPISEFRILSYEGFMFV